MLHKQQETGSCGLVPHSLLNQWRLSLSGYSTLHATSEFVNCSSAQDVEKDNERQTSIITKTLISMAEEMFEDTLIALSLA